ncbi:MAG: nicotinate-nucleotide--dimethylbenzimidazole phosphoribosyltransferase [Hydrogenophilaceae bacterium]|nr:nicotinate-nucleotide--dimethylbenzimidazole phosphoribosyltransferase [Hydrogenophilaceae bacterium]
MTPTPIERNDTWWRQPTKPLHRIAGEAAVRRQARLTKPPGALGRLEAVAIQLATMQGQERPTLDRAQITVFVGDHGVVAEGVSAFPQAVTGEMVKNFARGGAAINVLAREQGVRLEVVDLGTVNDPGPIEGVLLVRLAPSTANFTREPAMTYEQLEQALAAGRAAVDRAQVGGAQIFIAGEMGIGNTTAASALTCGLIGLSGQAMAGPGTGLDGEGVARKAAVIDRALARHAERLADPAETLRCLGGFELAAIAGACIACAQRGLPVLIDGFIVTAAALAAVRMQAGVRDWLLFSHASAEPGHVRLLQMLNAQPLVDLGLRLGEGSGAAVTLPLLRLACALHNGMATFAEAGVSEKQG